MMLMCIFLLALIVKVRKNEKEKEEVSEKWTLADMGEEGGQNVPKAVKQPLSIAAKLIFR